MTRRVRFLVVKELIELSRDPRLLSIVILAPLLQLLLLGYAATTDVRNVPLVVQDQDHSAASRALIERFERSTTFTVVGSAEGPADVDRALAHGTAWLGLTIPVGFGERAARGMPPAVQIVADGSDANSAGVALGYANSLVASYAQEISAGTARATGGQVTGPGLEPRVRVWFNPRLESRDFMIPGIVALLLLIVTTNLSSMAIVRERELGTLEQLNVTPLSRTELVVGKLLPYALLGLVEVLLVLVVAVAWFAVPLRGSVWLLIGMTIIFLIAALGLGLLISTISATQQQAMMTTIFYFLMPMIYLSGFVFPIENMPTVIQWATYLVPLRYFLVILRDIFLKGVGLDVLWPQALALGAWGTVVLALAVARSSKRLA
jgi:ABC-2 type transport system permease protein